MPESNVLFSVDPGKNTGITIWRNGEIFRTDFIETDITMDFVEQALNDLVHYFTIRLDRYKPANMVIEGVDYRSGSLKSVTAASRGNLSYLAYIVGAYCSAALSRGCECLIINAIQWKGNLKDDRVLERIKLIYPELPIKNVHIGCSIGIGMAYLNIGGFKIYGTHAGK